MTALMIAAKWKLLTIATSLVTYGADPSISTGSQRQLICIKGEIIYAYDAQAIDFCDEENKPLFEQAINAGFVAKKKRIRPLLNLYLPTVLRNIVEEYSHKHYAFEAQPRKP